MKAWVNFASAMAICASVVGCGADESTFTGKWVEQTASTRLPRTIDITFDRGVYMVEEHVPIGSAYKTQRDLAKFEGDNILTVKNGFQTLMFEDGILYYRSKTFVRNP